MGKYHVRYTKLYHCTECGETFLSNKRNAETCSNACRQKRYRRRQQARQDARKAQIRLPWEVNNDGG